MNNPKCHSCMPSGRTRLELASHVGGGGREAEAAKLAEVWLENANWYVSLWFLFFSCDFFWTNRRAADFIEYRWFSCDWHMGGIMFYLFLGVMLDKYQANTPRRYHVTWNRQTAIQNLLETIFAMILKKNERCDVPDFTVEGWDPIKRGIWSELFEMTSLFIQWRSKTSPWAMVGHVYYSLGH